ncbi:hypothetical protein J1N35_025530 [Gossypium stocksii]|uniref:Uncharacterized protein n=1 Tax=Gossypium stocksii TaxID=47602 RepID=A0A9D3ZX86_9ROSI|nr:hypothetical protein J1N35_025530 [Gossypium stocksii]
MAESIYRALRDGALEASWRLLSPSRTPSLLPLPYKCFLTIQILDCYSDPLGWKDQLARNRNFTALSSEALGSSTAIGFREVKHMDKLYNSIIELGKGLVGGGKFWFSIAIDSLGTICSLECTIKKFGA